MKIKFLIILFLIAIIGYSQGSSNISNAVNTPQSVANPPRLIGALPIPLGTWQVYVKDDIRWETYNINNFNSQVVTVTAGVYKPISYSPTSLEITTALGYTPYNSTNPNGYISSYTETDPIWSAASANYRTKAQNDLLYQPIGSYLTSETDPTVPTYSKSLTAFSVIKSSTDPLYEPIFVKNTAFNKNFGTASGTVAEGNDSRILNGQTAFSWGNHALAGYVTPSSINTFTNKGGNISQWTNDSGYLTGVTSGQVTSALGYTPVTNARTLTINGTTFDLSANRTWTVGDVTTATLTSSLATKENTIATGTTAQYWRGDKTWQILDKTAVGLANVDNTSDLSKPVSTATQTALNLKQDALVSGTNIKTVGGVSILGSGNISVGTGTVTSITAGTGLSGGTITTSGTISLPNTGTAGIYNTVITDAQGRVTSGFTATPSVVTRPINSTSFQVSTTQASRVKYTITHTIGLTLVLSSGSSMVYLEISPNNSTWTLVDQAGLSRSLAVAVVINDTMTNNVSAEVPAGYYVRIRTVTSGGGSTSYTCGQETIY